MTVETPDPHERVVQLEIELANIHHVHIDDIRALMSQFETEKAAWAQKLQEAVGRECGALCGDIERDRDDLAKEVQQLREEGVPGVMHEVDRMVFQVLEGDRDRFANLHRNLVERQRRVIGEYRAARHASRSVRLVEGLLADALGREPGSINGDNIEDAFAELVKERDHYREQWGIWAGKDSDINLNEQVVVALRQKISAAVGTDLPRDRLVEVFDNLVSQYRGQAVTEERARRMADEAGRREEQMAQAHANWASEVAAERARYAGLEYTAQAVGQQLTQALGWCDQMRARKAADTALMRRAYGIVTGAGLDDMPNPDLRERAREWVIAHEAREDALRKPGAAEDPLAEFDVRGESDGRHVKVYVEHSRSSCVRDMAWEMPQAETPLPDVLASAYRHLACEHAAHAPEPQDEAFPDDGDDPCDAICHPSAGACCGKVGDVLMEVNE